jgi:hypothetical protein
MWGQGSVHTGCMIFFPDIEKMWEIVNKKIASNYHTCFNMSKLAFLSVKNNLVLVIRHSVPVKESNYCFSVVE